MTDSTPLTTHVGGDEEGLVAQSLLRVRHFSQVDDHHVLHVGPQGAQHRVDGGSGSAQLRLVQLELVPGHQLGAGITIGTTY